ncbi:hypothetical protein Dimus_009698 [Dionaea muscipula]
MSIAPWQHGVNRKPSLFMKVEVTFHTPDPPKSSNPDYGVKSRVMTSACFSSFSFSPLLMQSNANLEKISFACDLLLEFVFAHVRNASVTVLSHFLNLVACLLEQPFASYVLFITMVLAFAIFRIQPVNDRVYYTKWYLRGLRSSSTNPDAFVRKCVNLSFGSYLKFLNWMPAALQMPETELIQHAGLDSAVYLRIYLVGLKIFIPITILALSIVIPVNWTDGGLEKSKLIAFNNLDKLSISNIRPGSEKFWTHIGMAYTVTFWACYILKKEYESIESMRLQFLASSGRKPEQFTVLVRNVPLDSDESTSELVEHFFKVNHPDDYLTRQVIYDANVLTDLVRERKKKQMWLNFYQLKYTRNQSRKPFCKTGFLGLWGTKVDAIDYYTMEVERLSKEISSKREMIANDTKAVMLAAFVSFKTRRGAAICAHTQQARNPTLWLTQWAPEPRDIYWRNLAIPYASLSIRKLIVSVTFFFLATFFMIPIAFVQSLANIEGIEKALPFLRPAIEARFVKSIIQGFLPGIVLKIFLTFLPSILMMMCKSEGIISLSALERRAAARYYVFLLINVFLGSIVTGTAFEQLNNILHETANAIPETIGAAIPMKVTFFITYTMVDGWAGMAAEILRLKPLICYHLKVCFLVNTEKDKEEAMNPQSFGFNTREPQIQLYFLVALVYAVAAPILLPFIVLLFSLGYIVYRHQIINVYNQEYESGAAFWPDVHKRIVVALVVSQLLLLGLLSTKKASHSTPLLVALPVLTISFHYLCKGRFLPAFVTHPLQEATLKDSMDLAREPGLHFKRYLQNAYTHPLLKVGDNAETDEAFQEVEQGCQLVQTKRQLWRTFS